MKWVILVSVLALSVFAVSAFVSRDERCMGGGSAYAPARSCEVSYWWD